MSDERAFAHLIPIESVELARAALVAGSPFSAHLNGLMFKPGLRWITRAAEAAILPGIQLHYALRKRHLEEVANRAIDAKVRQVVVVGAGLDSLALRLSRRERGVSCIEVDHPATQALKGEALCRLATPPGDLRLVSADLGRERLADALSRAGFRPEVPTLFVAEGLTMYLAPTDVQTLLSTCAECSPSGSLIAWTFMEPGDDGRLAFRGSHRSVVDAWLWARREPFTWGIRRDAVQDFVRPLGLELVEVATTEELVPRYLGDRWLGPAPASGELLCVVRKP